MGEDADSTRFLPRVTFLSQRDEVANPLPHVVGRAHGCHGKKKDEWPGIWVRRPSRGQITQSLEERPTYECDKRTSAKG